MATYVNDLRLTELATGEGSGTWGVTTNTNLELIGEALGYGTQDCFATDADATTTVADGATDPARAMYFKVTSTATLTATRTLTIAPNTMTRVMLIENATTGSQSIAISQGSGGNVTIANGAVKMVYLDGAGAGAAVVDALADLELGTITVADLTATTADINGGTIDGATIGGASAAAGTFTNLTATGTTTLAGASTTADITFGDNDKAVFGAGSDLQIYHDGINSYIDDAGTGGLFIRSNEFLIQKYTGEAVIYAVADGAVNLYYDNAAKLATTATGIDVTGTVTADGLDSSGALILGVSGSTNGFINTGESLYINIDSNNDQADTRLFQVGKNSTSTSGGKIILASENGDISFYEDTGTTPKFFWDASAESLGIGTSSPDTKLHVLSASAESVRIAYDATKTARLGVTSAGDLQVYAFDGSSYRNILLAVDSTTSAGNVGIGTSSPAEKLHIHGGASATRLRISGGALSDTYGGFVEGEGISGSGGVLRLGVVDNSTDRTAILINPQAASIVFSTGSTPTERMRIDTSGNVGIGTSSPAAKLEVYGPNATGTFFKAWNAGANGAIFSRVNASSFPYNHFEFDNGYVGINKTSPTTHLDVNGNASISGSLSKGSGSFKIDHPVKPETHHLVHSFVEAPQADNIYRGKVELVDGVATVNIDTVAGMTEGTFVLLNREVQCFTSNESGWTAVRGKVDGNILTIEAQDPVCTDTISWLVVGERQDQHMYDTDWTDENGKVIVEPPKETEGA